MDTSRKAYFEGLINETEIDYINLHQFYGAANYASDADPEMDPMDQTLHVLGLALDLGFRCVDMKKGGGITPWPDQDRDRITAHIRREWERSGDEGIIGLSYWFDLPDDRRAPAHAALARW